MRFLSVLAAVLALATPAAADCPRKAPMPAELPWMECPVAVSIPPCRACLKGDTHLNLAYEGDEGAIGTRWIQTLTDAGWEVTVHGTVFIKPPKIGDTLLVVDAHHGHDTATTTVQFGGTKGTVTQTVLAIRFSPG